MMLRLPFTKRQPLFFWNYEFKIFIFVRYYVFFQFTGPLNPSVPCLLVAVNTLFGF